MTKKFSIDWPPRFESELDFDTSSEKKAKAATLARDARKRNKNEAWNHISKIVLSSKIPD